MYTFFWSSWHKVCHPFFHIVAIRYHGLFVLKFLWCFLFAYILWCLLASILVALTKMALLLVWDTYSKAHVYCNTEKWAPFCVQQKLFFCLFIFKFNQFVKKTHLGEKCSPDRFLREDILIYLGMGWGRVYVPWWIWWYGVPKRNVTTSSWLSFLHGSFFLPNSNSWW
jgi:hypothetical protein